MAETAAKQHNKPFWRFWDRRSGESSLENPSTDLVQALTGGLDAGTPAGITVTPEKALRLISVYSCVRVVSEAVASLPFPIYRQEGKSRVRMGDDPRWGLLNEQPNPEMYAMELWEQVIAHANLWGKGYAHIVRDNAGEVIELWPLPASRMQRRRTPANQLFYVLTLDSGERVPIPMEDVIEIRGFLGLSPIQKVARDEIAAGLAAQEYGGRFWANSARPDGIISVEGQMDDLQFEEFKKRWQAGHGGLRRSHLVGILTNGATWTDVGIPPEDAQFIETRKYTARQIAGMYLVPPYKIGDMEPGSVSYASVEAQQIGFVVDSVRPWLVRTEQAVRNRIFNSKRDREAGVYPEFLVEGLLRGDTLSRYRAYAIGIQWGFLNRSEPRQRENLLHHEELDEFLVPSNMLAAGADPAQVAEEISRAARELGMPPEKAAELELQLLQDLDLRALLEKRSNGAGSS